MPSKESFEQQEIQDGKVFAILAYLSILCIIPLVLKKDNAFVLSHGKQGLVLFVGQVAAFVISIVIPWIWQPSLFVFGILSLWGIIETLRGRFVKLPVVSDFADKITL
jgi:uncharacterized membrane protein